MVIGGSGTDFLHVMARVDVELLAGHRALRRVIGDLVNVSEGLRRGGVDGGKLVAAHRTHQRDFLHRRGNGGRRRGWRRRGCGRGCSFRYGFCCDRGVLGG